MVLDKHELSMPSGWHASHPRRGQPYEIGMYLSSDEHVGLLSA
jgi:hypothetical protein